MPVGLRLVSFERATVVFLGLTLVALAHVSTDHHAAAAEAGWSTRPATYGVAMTRDVRIRMSDGATLVADVYRPADARGRPVPGRFPVVLTQTPYNKNGPLSFAADHLVTRGYVQVIVDVRGTGSSEGTWRAFGRREQRDGEELVEWVASPGRPWSDGRVALHGTSYGAINQLLTAARQPRGLKAIFPVVPVADVYRDVVASGGELDASFIPMWLALVTGTSLVPPAYTGTDPALAASAMSDHARGAATFQGLSTVSFLRGGTLAYDGPFYRTRSPIEVIDRVRVPTFVVGGWFDLFQRGEPMLYQRLAANGVPARLLMGPWYHANVGEGLPAQGVPSLEDLEVHWFDRHVLGRPDRRLEQLSNVTLMDLGTGRYTATPSWPPRGVRYLERYLSGPAAPGRPGSLATAPPSRQGADVLPWQPVSGVCTRSTAQWTAGAAAGTPCENHNELNDLTGLVYDLPLSEPLRLAGPIAARLAVSTNGRDSMLTVRVEDVAPDGTSTQLTAGWNTISFRAIDRTRTVRARGTVVQPYHPFTEESLLPVEKEEVYELWVEIFPTAATIPAGHRLRIAVQPSDTPHLGWTVPQMMRQPGAVIRLHHDAEHPSVVVLPQLP